MPAPASIVTCASPPATQPMTLASSISRSAKPPRIMRLAGEHEERDRHQRESVDRVHHALRQHVEVDAAHRERDQRREAEREGERHPKQRDDEEARGGSWRSFGRKLLPLRASREDAVEKMEERDAPLRRRAAA